MVSTIVFNKAKRNGAEWLLKRYLLQFSSCIQNSVKLGAHLFFRKWFSGFRFAFSKMGFSYFVMLFTLSFIYMVDNLVLSY